MNGKVLFTNDLDYEVNKIQSGSQGCGRKFYIYSTPLVDLKKLKEKLPEFSFIELKEVLNPENSHLFHENIEQDFFVLKCLRFSRVTDKNVEFLQTALKGYKLVVDVHPFLEKKDLYWSYFLWSFFDRNLMGYPHAYAFKSATEKREMDLVELSKKVAPGTQTTIHTVFGEDIQIKRIALCEQMHRDYKDLKKALFEKETVPFIIIGKLKRFLKEKIPELSDGFDLLNLGKVYKQYLGGERSLVISDAKVDIYLEKEFWSYIQRVNSFMSAIWDCSHVR